MAFGVRYTRKTILPLNQRIFSSEQQGLATAARPSEKLPLKRATNLPQNVGSYMFTTPTHTHRLMNAVPCGSTAHIMLTWQTHAVLARR
jgi:hypothetical protein